MYSWAVGAPVFMKRSVHAFMGFAMGLLIAGVSPYAMLCGSAGFLGGWFPDYDLRFRHRKLLHNIFAAAAASIVFYYVVDGALRVFGRGLGGEAAWYMAVSFMAGWILHILLDSTTKRGTYILWPLVGRPLRIPLYRSNSLAANGLALLVSMLMIYMWLRNAWGMLEKTWL